MTNVESWINAFIQTYDLSEPQQKRNMFALVFDVNTELRKTSLCRARFIQPSIFKSVEEHEELTIYLSSDDFVIHTGSQQLQVASNGTSLGKVYFQVEPKHQGEGLIKAFLLRSGNYIQSIELKIPSGACDGKRLVSSEPLRRSVVALFDVKPRDVHLNFHTTSSGFKLYFSNGVLQTCDLHITPHEIANMIDTMHKKLNKIINIKINGNKAVYQSEISIPEEVNGKALKYLAEAGFLLYRRLFFSQSADAQVNRIGNDLRKMTQGKKLKIVIVSDRFLFPWDILYTTERWDDKNINPEMFLGFKHIIEHIPMQQERRVTGLTIESRGGLNVCLNVDDNIDQEMGVTLVKDQLNYWKKHEYNNIIKVTVNKTREGVLNFLTNTSFFAQILYFYCHAGSKSPTESNEFNDSYLKFSDSECLKLKDLELYAPLQQSLPGIPLVFINACESAKLSPLFYEGFLPYFMSKGARGIIGTECEVPALFAAEWAKRFFNKFLSGTPLGQTFLELRQEFLNEHNNLLGLLYTLYCDGDTQIVPGIPNINQHNTQ